MKIKQFVKDISIAVGVLAINIYVFAMSLVRPNDWKLFFKTKAEKKS